MAITYEAIANGTLSAGAAQFNFTQIPQTYTDLRVIVTATNPVGNGQYTLMRLNNNSNSVYGQQFMTGSGASNKLAYLASGIQQFYLNYTWTNQFDSSEFPIYMIDIFNYSTTGMYKPVLISNGRSGNSGGTVGVEKSVSQFASTLAVTSLQIFSSGGSVNNRSRVVIYGIKRA